MSSLTFVPSSDTFKPHLAYFPNGPPPPSVLDSPTDLNISVYRHAKKRGSEVLVAETPKMVYSCQASSDPISNYYVAVFNKATGKVRLVETSCVFKLQQSLKAYNPNLPAATGSNFAEQRRFLVENFASKKKKQEVKSKLANMIAKEGVSKSGSIMETIKEQAEKEDIKKIAVRDDLPHYNAGTENVAEIFPLDSIVPSEELGLFSKEADELLQATAQPEKLAAMEASNLYGNYVMAHLKAGLKATDEQRKLTALLLVFVAHLLAFSKYITVNRRKGYFVREITTALPDLPEPVVRRFLNTFCSPVVPGGDRFKNDRERSVKLINYVLITCLTIDNFLLDTRDIAKDLQLQPQQCALHLLAIGCKRAKSAPPRGSDDIATPVLKLQAPLQFPDPKRGKRRE